MNTPKVIAVRATEDGRPNLFKTWIGVGGAGFVAIALLSFGGCENRSPKHPTAIELVGKWKSEGTSYKDTRTYTGIYDFYAIGKHTYDILLSDGVHKQGHGVWNLAQETDTLQVENDTGSVYVGTFKGGIFTAITLTTTNKQWGLVLKKEEGNSTTSALR
ncbi:MAG: hypothetical protein KJ630_13100 [Proteobacteria bacterium]|nr:hypothetical protein [Pseudomonadota bacterium]